MYPVWWVARNRVPWAKIGNSGIALFLNFTETLAWRAQNLAQGNQSCSSSDPLSPASFGLGSATLAPRM